MMSEKWAGFTDEDIERIKSDPNVTKSCRDTICDLDGYAPATKNRGPMKIKKIPLKSDMNDYSNDMCEANSIYKESRTEESPSSYKKLSSLKGSDTDLRLDESEMSCTCNNYIYEGNQKELPVTADVYSEACDPKCEEMDQSSTNLLPLEIFEMRQKRIEAENARRRTLISKAINDKKKRTQAEAVKLAKITQELNHIDSSLSADVSILRDYIEKASLEFSEAEKRYLKAEKEFVEAKLVLFDKMQRKEMLTEHLCAIIEQNENRKADKLVELMKQLEMEVIVEDCEINGIQSILPNLCSLNDEPYHSCQTIKPVLSGGNSEENIVGEINQKSECNETRDVEVSNEIMDKNISDNVSVEENSSVEEPKEEKVEYQKS